MLHGYLLLHISKPLQRSRGQFGLLAYTLTVVFSEFGLSISSAKCQWCVPVLEFMGHFVDRYRLGPAQSKVDAVSQLSVPSIVEQLQQYLTPVTWALTRMSRSHDWSLKLHQGPLRLMEYDMTMQRRTNVSHRLPDACSPLRHCEQPGKDVESCFPDDVSRPCRLFLRPARTIIEWRTSQWS